MERRLHIFFEKLNLILLFLVFACLFVPQLYNWDSYFISLGLLIDNRLDMAKNIVEHFIFEISASSFMKFNFFF